MTTRDGGKGGRDAVLAAAEAQFDEAGLAGFTVRAVAARCGMTATALYRHFADRDALLAEVLRRGRDRFDAALAQGAELPDPLDRLLATGAGYLEFVAASPRMYEALFMTPPAQARDFDAHFGAGRARGFAILLDRIRACQRAGRLPAGDTTELALTLWSSIHGFAALHLTGQLGLAPAQFLARGRALTRRVTGLTAKPGEGARRRQS